MSRSSLLGSKSGLLNLNVNLKPNENKSNSHKNHWLPRGVVYTVYCASTQIILSTHAHMLDHTRASWKDKTLPLEFLEKNFSTSSMIITYKRIEYVSNECSLYNVLRSQWIWFQHHCPLLIWITHAKCSHKLSSYISREENFERKTTYRKWKI